MTFSLADLTRAFARIGVLSFGGPAAQISLMHRELVDEKQWVTEKEYLSALSFCMLLPGPEAMQLATWIGWRSHGWRGGLIAGGLFVLPGAVIVLALSMIYAGFGQIPLIAAMFTGVQAAVVAVVIEALLRVAKRALKTRTQRVIAVLAFVALYAFALPFPVVILAAGLWGFARARGQTGKFPPAPQARTAQTLALWLALWLIPLAALWPFEGAILFHIGAYFAKLAVLTFGGAYAVLAWMAQTVVQDMGWLTLPQMMDGLGLAETTPGPLILVTEFVGYMAGYGVGGWQLGLAAALITLWMTFVPSFMFIFVGAPYIARLTANPRLAGALAAITAAVVGVIANLSLWFGVHVLFARQIAIGGPPLHLSLPDLTSLQPLAALIALGAAYALLIRHWQLPLVLVLAATAPTLWALI
jgi:chromate transporter